MQSEKEKLHSLEVHVKSLKSGAKTHFQIAETATLDQVWNQAVSAAHLNEPRNAGDEFRCAGGADFTKQLQLTVAQVRSAKTCTDLHFEIKGPSGGACA